MLSPEQGYTAYLQLDGPRTLEKLRQKLSEDGVEVPTLRWCQKWCARDKWRDRAKEHDRQVELRTSEKIAEAVATKRADFGTAIDEAGIATCQQLGELADTCNDIDQLIKAVSVLADASAAIKSTGRTEEASTLLGPYTVGEIANGHDPLLEALDLAVSQMPELPPPEDA